MPEWRKKYVRPHVLPWSTWLDKLPSLSGLNRRDVRIVAGTSVGKFTLATGHTSYVSVIEVFQLRKKLREQANLKRNLFRLRTELIQKTHGLILAEDGSISERNEPGPNIQAEIARIQSTLKVFTDYKIDIKKAVLAIPEMLF